MAYVIKESGEKQEFDKNKIINTCLRAGVSEKNAIKIADEVSAKIYDGISTREILKIVLKRLNTISEPHALKYDLRGAVSRLTEEDEFEKYVEHILRAHNYETQWNIILKGELVEHQIDIIAKLGDKKYFVECKHHINPHRFCGLQIVLEVWAAFDDLSKGGQNFENAWLITNTKFSEHAVRYANGKKLLLTGWNYPANNSLADLISNKALYPITILSLAPEIRERFRDAGILLVKELLELSFDEIFERTKIKKSVLKGLVEKAKKILG